jgi:hypothetical protein
MEQWSDGVMEDWKIGRLEDWHGGNFHHRDTENTKGRVHTVRRSRFAVRGRRGRGGRVRFGVRGSEFRFPQIRNPQSEIVTSVFRLPTADTDTDTDH